MNVDDPLAYFITWTIYGTWLPGDSRGWRKRSQGEQPPRPCLAEWHCDRLKHPILTLNCGHREVVEQECRRLSSYRGWQLWTVNARSNHVHTVISAKGASGGTVRDQLKANRTRMLREWDVSFQNRPVWAVGGDWQCINTESDLEAACYYVSEGQDRRPEPGRERVPADGLMSLSKIIPEMSASTPTPAELSRLLKARGAELGFDLLGIAAAARPDTLGHLHRWLDQGLHAEMLYMPRRRDAYSHPQGVLASVKSIVIAALNYGPPVEMPDKIGRIAAYAQGSGDYHDVLRSKLSQLADGLHELSPGSRTRIAVDTAPLLEREVAQQAGLGWFGKNTMLINKHRGSYFFLGAVLTDCELAPDPPHAASHCGTCTRCLDACPTQAFPEPHVLDASRCISYLTIELRNQPIPRDLREGMEDWLFGCDVCQQVCPWNRKAQPAHEPAFQVAQDGIPDALELLMLSEQEFQRRFGETPLARPGRAGMVRNAVIVLANSGRREFASPLIPLLEDESPLVRGAAAWGLGKLNSSDGREAVTLRFARETDASARTEMELVLSSFSSD